MQNSARSRFRRASSFVLMAASAGLLAACASPQPKAMMNKQRSKEYFSETEYGVKASPYARVAKTVGRDQIGKPYQVRGKWYYPKEDKKYSKVGQASWYGSAFHGRYTANGEVYNMADLTAAHPTMPLPSYARVTNLSTGASIIVRVNDRGPYSDGRIIDLSQRAAQMLDYARVGTAKVKVEYVGRAPLEGHDQQYLVASYQPGNKPLDPSVGLPTGVMVAMNGPSPSMPVAAAAIPFPGELNNAPPAAAAQPVMTAQDTSMDGVSLPAFGPVAPERPDVVGMPSQIPFTVASLNYADERVARAADPFSPLEARGVTSDDVARSWKQMGHAAPADSDQAYVAAGTFDDAAEAGRVASQLSRSGKAQVQRSTLDGKDWYSVNVYPDGKGNIDDLLQAAWAHGAPDALAVRD